MAGTSLWHDNLRVESLERALTDKYGAGYEDCPQIGLYPLNDEAGDEEPENNSRRDLDGYF